MKLAEKIAREIASADDYCCIYGHGWSVRDLEEIVAAKLKPLEEALERAIKYASWSPAGEALAILWGQR